MHVLSRCTCGQIFFDFAGHVPVDDVISCLATRSASRDRVGVNGHGHLSVGPPPTKSSSRGRGERPPRAGTANTDQKCAGNGRLLAYGDPQHLDEPTTRMCVKKAD